MLDNPDLPVTTKESASSARSDIGKWSSVEKEAFGQIRLNRGFKMKSTQSISPSTASQSAESSSMSLDPR